jgi:N-acetylmuramoyl-L-alanine amidase
MRFIKPFSLFIFAFIISFNCWSLSILVDPGHGGDDKGARGSYLKSLKKGINQERQVLEKDIALQLAKRIYKKLQKKYKVYLTRSVDRTVSLEKRAEVADKIKADLFISIHANSSTNRKPRGFETYYLDNHKDAAVKKVESVENRNLKGDALVVNQILTDLVVERTASDSKSLANSIHGQIQKRVGKSFKLINRGVKPGLFYVLALAKRPAVLLEVGFISNKKELKRIMSPRFQERYAEAVVRGIDIFVKKMKKKGTPSLF